MNKAEEVLALRKRLLVARSALCRLKIRNEVGALRESVSRRHGAAPASASPARAAAFDIAVEALGKDRMSRFLAFASRALMVARIARIVASLLGTAPAGSSRG
jgi:hypothetical protein